MALVRANFEFWAENQAELSFQVGDIIKVLNRDDEGWWEGELGGRRGLFPSNYVEPYTAINNYRAGGAQQQQQQGWGNRSNVGGGSQVGGNRSVVNGGGSNVGNRSNMGNGSQAGSGMNNQQGWNNNMNNNNNQRWDNGSQVGSNVGNRSNAGNNNNMNNNNQQGWAQRSNVGSNMGNNNKNNQQGWNNMNNTNQQQGWDNRSNAGSSVGNGSQTGLLNNRNNMGSSSQVSNNRMNNNNNMGNGSQVGGRSNVGNGSQVGNNNNWNNNMNNNMNNMNNNWNNNNNNNWNNNNMPMNNNQPSFQRDGNNEWGGNGNMKKPANLDTYNNIVNAFNNTNEPPRQATAQPKPATIDEPVKKPAAQPTNFTARAKVSPTKYGPWASNMGDITGMTMVGLGICSMVWSLADMAHFGPFPLWTGAYGIAMGVVICLFENSRWGQARGPSRVPWRAIAYLAISIFLFFSLPMLLTGLCCVLVAGVNLIATVKGEVYDAPAKQSHDSGADAGYFSNLYQYLVSFREQNKIGVLVFLGAYFLGNLILFFVVLWQFIKTGAQTEQTNPGMATSYWIPYAKGFGNLLDMNCAFIVLPVCRTFLRMLYNRSTADQSLFARFLRGILYFIPIDKNLAFHKLIAKLIWISAVGHTIAHFLNFAFTPTITFGIYGLSPFLTGGTLCAVILLIYSSARDNVRRGQFEIFWYNHHTFVIFFVATLFHGKNSLGPNYYKWFALPGTIYLLERLLRIYRAYQKVVITSVTIMDDVLSVEIAKEGVFEAPYKEGQYIFLQSPPISQIQWHPFTISSAPQEQTVTVHIRVCGEGSWTKGLRDYLGSMGPKGRPYFQLDRQGPAGKLVGKIFGPDGQAMLRIDGPHSAPTQHLGEYSAAMISGAGIGVTPVASTLKSVVFHKWKYYIGQCFPDHAYFFWVCGHKDVNAFRWLIRHIKDAQDEVTHMRATNPQNMASKTFEFHIYVSSVPKDQKPVEVVVDDEIGFWGVPREDAKVDKVRCNWDEVDLYKTMLCPPAHTELGDVHVWNGRPQWDPRFAAVARNHPYMDIGVMFCGNPAIGRDLRRMCHIHSKGRTQGIFKLHKENF